MNENVKVVFGLHVGSPGLDGKAADRRDRRQRLPAKPQRGDPVDILFGENFAGAVRFDAEQRVVAVHAGAVIRHGNQPGTGFFNFNADMPGARVDRVLHELLHYGGGTLDHLSGGNPVAELFGHHFNLAHR